jgi:hypothetical protein
VSGWGMILRSGEGALSASGVVPCAVEVAQ